jgi:hypothetical protein
MFCPSGDESGFGADSNRGLAITFTELKEHGLVFSEVFSEKSNSRGGIGFQILYVLAMTVGMSDNLSALFEAY